MPIVRIDFMKQLKRALARLGKENCICTFHRVAGKIDEEKRQPVPPNSGQSFQAVLYIMTDGGTFERIQTGVLRCRSQVAQQALEILKRMGKVEFQDFSTYKIEDADLEFSEWFSSNTLNEDEDMNALVEDGDANPRRAELNDLTLNDIVKNNCTQIEEMLQEIKKAVDSLVNRE